MQVFCKCKVNSQFTLSKDTTFSNVGVPHPIGERFSKSKKLRFPQGKKKIQPQDFNISSCQRISRLMACPIYFRLASPTVYNCMSQFLKINPFIYLYIISVRILRRNKNSRRYTYIHNLYI